MKSVFLLLLLTGCTLIKEIKKPPYPYTATHHTRVLGIKLGYGDYVLQLGGVDDTVTLLPTFTNRLYTATFSDRFKVGTGGATITEQLDSGFEGQPPPLQMRLFAPNATHLPVEPMHSNVMQRQGRESVTISRQEYDGLKGAEMLRQKLMEPK